MHRFRGSRRRAGALIALGLTTIASGAGVNPSAAQTNDTAADRATDLRISERTVQYGQRFNVGGTVPGDLGTRLRLQFRARGAQGWETQRTLHSEADGDFSARVAAQRTGAYRVVPARGRISTVEKVRVRGSANLRLASRNIKVGEDLRLTGRAFPGGRREVKIVIRGAETEVLRATTGPEGRFRLAWTPAATGSVRFRAYVEADRAAAAGSSNARAATVFRAALASWYGPGFYGNRTGCGQTLTTGMIGVAHKSLPCGTKVTFRYRGRSVRAPVIDRGPYVGNREFDLTAALRQRLGFPSTGIVYVNR